jgi:U2 small nuclear ribonucleoprotein A'
LSNNRISKLNTLIPIEQLVNLERLSLIGNPVTKVQHYRFFVIHLLQYSRKFRYLDFQRVTDAEREEAKRFFESSEGAEFLAQTQPAIEELRVSKKPDVEPRFTFSAEILNKLRVAISDATDMETVSKLEHALKTGAISEDVAALIGLS